MTQFDQRYQQVEQQYNAGRDINIYPNGVPYGMTPVQQRQNRERMIERVRIFWIKGVLEQSLQHVVSLPLGLAEHPNVVDNPWQLTVQETNQQAHSLPPGTPITWVYDHADRTLLILGEPGSGKTTLLLQLARDLLDRAEHDEAHPIPVIFNLSSWAVKQQSLAQWLIEELTLKYQVPRKVAQFWIDDEQILPLLDGLDEVAAQARIACVNTINAYREDYGLVPIVVCSRSTEYLAQTTRLQMHSAVIVQPLTTQQIDDYLSSVGEQLVSVRAALHNDPKLQELAITPLMLNILILAHQNKPPKDLLKADSPEALWHHVFATYVQRMLQRRSAEIRYASHQTEYWLAWLARQLTLHSQTEFYIEQMQPEWLSESQSRRIYEHLAIRLPDMLIGMIVCLLVINMLFSSTVFNVLFELYYGIIGGLVGGLVSRRQQVRLFAESDVRLWRSFWRYIIDVRYLRNGLVVGLIYGLIYGLNYEPRIGLIYGSVFGLVSYLLSVILEGSKLTRLPAKMTIWSWRSLWQNLIKFGYLGIGLTVGLSYGLGYVLSTEITHQLHTSQSDVLAYALAFVLIYTLVGILINLILEGRKPLIQPAEIVIFSWSSLWRSLINIKHLRNGLLVGLLVGLIIGLSGELRVGLTFGLNFGLNAALTFGLSYWLLIGLFKGLSSNMLDEHQRIKPNQGIWRSAQNSIRVVLISGLISWFVCCLSYTLSYVFIFGLGPALSVGLTVAKSIGLLVGVSLGLLCGLLNGGVACIQHGILHLLLWRARSIPWNYPQFLDYAAERILLRKVGGGYIFIHRLLLDYFASLDIASTSPEEVKQVQDAASVS